MTFTWRVYIALALVVAVDYALAWFLPIADFLRVVVSTPAIAALIAAVFQIFRDQAEYEKRLLLQRDQQHFVLGATSPMAGAAFSKHVEFCEKYIARMQEGLSELFAEGPTRKALKFASDLTNIRLSYRAWLTTDLQNKIMPFEEALTKIGGLSGVVANSNDPKRREQRMTQYIKRLTVSPIYAWLVRKLTKKLPLEKSLTTCRTYLESNSSFI